MNHQIGDSVLVKSGTPCPEFDIGGWQGRITDLTWADDPVERVYELCPPEERRVPEKPPEYAALEPILERQGYVKNRDIRLALGVSAQQANRIARRLEELGWLRREGEKRGTCYLPAKERAG